MLGDSQPGTGGGWRGRAPRTRRKLPAEMKISLVLLHHLRKQMWEAVPCEGELWEGWGSPQPGTCLSSGRSPISRHFCPALELCIPIPAACIPWVPRHSSPLIVLSLMSLFPLPGTPFLHLLLCQPCLDASCCRQLFAPTSRVLCKPLHFYSTIMFVFSSLH